jgi:hypothetical protein
MLRWNLRLAEYDFTVEYRPEKKIPHVDSLSTYICAVSNQGTIEQERVREEQEKDSFCRTLYTGGQSFRAGFFKDLNGVV